MIEGYKWNFSHIRILGKVSKLAKMKSEEFSLTGEGVNHIPYLSFYISILIKKINCKYPPVWLLKMLAKKIPTLPMDDPRMTQKDPR